MARSARPTVVCVATLSAGVSSTSADVTTAWLVTTPAAVALALNVIVTLWPGASEAKLHSTWLLIAEHMPDGDVA